MRRETLAKIRNICLTAMAAVVFSLAARAGGSTAWAAEFTRDTDGIDSGSTYLVTMYDEDTKKHYAWGIGSDGKMISAEVSVSGDTATTSDSRIQWVVTREDNGYSMRVGSRYLNVKYDHGVVIRTTQEPVSGMNYRDGHMYFSPAGSNAYLYGKYYHNQFGFVFKVIEKESWAADIVLYRLGGASAGNSASSGLTWERAERNRFWRCKNQNGEYVTNRWLQDGGLWYYFDENSNMKTGWLTLDDGTYYLYDNGAMAVSAELSLGGLGYTFDASGRMVPNDPNDPCRIPLPDDMKEGVQTGMMSSVADDNMPVNWINGKRKEAGKPVWKRDNRLCLLARDAYYASNQLVPLSELMQMGSRAGLAFSHVGTIRIMVSQAHPFEEYYNSMPELRDMIATDLMTHVGVYAEKTGADAVTYVFVTAAY